MTPRGPLFAGRYIIKGGCFIEEIKNMISRLIYDEFWDWGQEKK